MNWLALVSALVTLARNLVDMLRRSGNVARTNRQAELEAKAKAYTRLVRAVRARQQSRDAVKRIGKRGEPPALDGDRLVDNGGDGGLRVDKYRRD